MVSYEWSIRLSTEAGNVLRTLYAFLVDSGMLRIVQSGPLAADPLHFPTPISFYPLGPMSHSFTGHLDHGHLGRKLVKSP